MSAGERWRSVHRATVKEASAKKRSAKAKSRAKRKHRGRASFAGHDAPNLADGFGVSKHGQDTGIAPAHFVYAGGDRDCASGRGHHHPGVNQAVLQEWFRTASEPKPAAALAALFNLVQWRRAGKLRDLLPGHHALHQRVDHDAVADRGDSAAWQAGARRWRAAEDHAVDALRDTWAVHFSRLPAGAVVSAPGIVSHHAAGNH